MKMKKKSSRSMAPKRTVDQLPFRIPPILLEGDESSAPAPAMGAGQKYALGPAAPAGHFESEAARLPEAYGTRTLLLTARDPHWLYAHWDIAREEQRQYSAPAAGRHLVLRVYEGAVSGSPAAQIQLHPDSRHWSVYVPRAETPYVAELGCSLPGGRWQRLATSEVATTPPDTVSQDISVRFATIEPLAAARAAPVSRPERQRGVPGLLPAEAGVPAAPIPRPARPAPTTQPSDEPEAPSAPRPQELPLSTPQANRETSPGKPAPGPEPAGVVSQPAELLLPHPVSVECRVSSVELLSQFAEPLLPHLEGNIDSQAAEELGLPSLAGAEAGITSPGMAAAPAGAREEPPETFWFHINAELVLYGATEPDAQVAIAGQPIRLRPDGTFSYRFALPDGDYDLLATAISAHDDRRQVRLQFSRRTD
jgi:hypothetical protein